MKYVWRNPVVLIATEILLKIQLSVAVVIISNGSREVTCTVLNFSSLFHINDCNMLGNIFVISDFHPNFSLCCLLNALNIWIKLLGSKEQSAGRCVAKMRKCERKEGEKNLVSANKLTQFLKMHTFRKN